MSWGSMQGRRAHERPVRRPQRARAARVAREPGRHSIVLVALAVLLFAVTWVAARAWYAKAELQQAETLVGTLKSEIGAGKISGTAEKYLEIRQHTATARSLTTDPLWTVAARVPFVGRNFSVMHALTVDVDDAMQLGQPLVTLASQLGPETLAPKNGAVPLQPIVEAAQEVASAADGLAALDQRVSGLDTHGTVPQLQAAHRQLSTLIDSVSAMASQASPIVQALPAILGSQGQRTYVVTFLNNAELRPLGGTALSFAEISVDNGAIKLVRTVPAGLDNFARHPTSVIPVPDGFEDLLPGQLGRFIPETSLRPSKLTAAQIVQAEWRIQFGKDIDGVITVDAGALALLVKATGPIPLTTGDVLTADNTVSLLLNEVYTRYNSGNVLADNLKQNIVYNEAVDSTFTRLSSGQFDPVTLFTSARTAAAGNRLSVWFADPQEQKVFGATSFGAHGLPESTTTEDAVGVYLVDRVGAKLDYYLGSTLTTGSAVCTQDGRQTHRLTLALTNGLPASAAANLSPSISGSLYGRLGLQKGEQQVLVWFYLPPGSTVVSTSVDGKPVATTDQHDTDHPVQSVTVQMLPGAASQITIDIRMGQPGTRTLVTDVTPTVKGTKVTAAPLDCSTVAAG